MAQRHYHRCLWIVVALLPTLACTPGDPPRPDRGPTVEIRAHLDPPPRHLESDVVPSVVIKLGFDTYGVGVAEGLQRVQQATTVSTWPGKQPVSGKWRPRVFGCPCCFSPDTPLAEGDYMVRIEPDGDKLQPEREYTLFHIGPLPRVRRIEIGTNDLIVVLSEQVDPNKVKLTLERAQGGGFKVIETKNRGGMPYTESASFKLDAPLDLDVRHRVTVAQKVGAASGIELDGKYMGKAGSGPFAATFVPRDHMVGGPVSFEPKLVY